MFPERNQGYALSLIIPILYGKCFFSQPPPQIVPTFEVTEQEAWTQGSFAHIYHFLP